MFCLNRYLSVVSITMFGGMVLSLASGCCATSGWIFNNSGCGYYSRGQYAMARDEFRRATIDAPNNPQYWHNLAMAMKQTGDVVGAEQVLRQNLTQVSAMHQPTYHSLAQILVEQNRHAEAQDLLTGWSQSQPYVTEAHVEMAWIQRETGNLPGAEQSLRQALQLNPRHPAALAHLGQLYQDSGQTDRAVSMYQRSLASKWGQPEVQSRMQLLADGSSRTTRSAMMVNPMQPSYAAGPMPMMAMSPMMTVSSTPMMTQAAPIMMTLPMPGPTPDPATSMPMMASDSGMTFEQPIVIGAMPNADPAHVQIEMTAELPLVAPH